MNKLSSILYFTSFFQFFGNFYMIGHRTKKSIYIYIYVHICSITERKEVSILYFTFRNFFLYKLNQFFPIILKSNQGGKGETRVLPEYNGSTVEVPWKYSGSTWEYRGVQWKYSGVQWKYKGVQWKYSGVQWKYRGVQWKYRGVQSKYSGVSSRQYSGVQWEYAIRESRFISLESNPSQGPLVLI